mmetsp:Transcript_6555/g.7934  ORF Transcript_6555/g.7934 Transcript_6555/m.7934 type:complete len:158 (-) Transcript_6555:35-508(-)
MERQTKTFFSAMAAIWMGYGSYCFVKPNILELMCGMRVKESDKSTGLEIQAMYGGLQFAVGFQALMTLLNGDKKPYQVVGTLRTFVYLFFGLGLSRALAIFLSGRSQIPRVSLKVLTEGLEVLLPKYYNQNATWIFEIPGGLIAYYLLLIEEGKLLK